MLIVIVTLVIIYCDYCLSEIDQDKLDYDSGDSVRVKHCPSCGATLYDYPVCYD